MRLQNSLPLYKVNSSLTHSFKTNLDLCNERNQLITLADRREQYLPNNFFEQLTHPDSCLTHLVPPKRDLSIYLRHTRLHELPKARTARYTKSFLPYCLYNFN